MTKILIYLIIAAIVYSIVTGQSPFIFMAAIIFSLCFIGLLDTLGI